MKTIKVLLPITVPNSTYCVNHEYRTTCDHFCFGDCRHNFRPLYDKKSGNFLKPEECKSLIWEDNLK